MPFFSSVSASVRKRFYDTFTRTNTTGGLGTATDGSLWNAIRGTFTVATNKATGDTSNYPMSTQRMPTTNNQIAIQSTSQGAAAALWVTDANNWWAVGIDQTSTSCNCQTCSQCNAYNTNNCNAYSGGNCATNTGGNCASNTGGNCASNTGGNCASSSGGTCKAWNAPPCNAYFCSVWSGSYCVSPPGGGCKTYGTGTCSSWNAVTCNAWNPITCATWNAVTCASWNAITCTSWNATVCSGTWNGSNCASTSYYSCNCQTCYPQYLRVMKSVASTISEVTNWTIASVVSSFRVKTTGTAITAQVYSDTALTTQIGTDLTYTATGATVIGEYGITIKPSSANQAYTLGTIDITRN